MIPLLLTWLVSPLLWLRWLLRGPARPPRNILLIQTAKIGDLVCTTPVLRQIKRRFPGARLSVLVSPTTVALLKHNPHVDALFVLPPLGVHGASGKAWLYRLLLRENIDTTICASPNLVYFLAPFWAGVARRLAILPDRAGRSMGLAAAFLTAAEAHRAGRTTLETLFALLRRLGVETDLRTEVFPSPTAKERAAEFLPHGAHCVGLGISSGNKLKELSDDQLSLIIRRLLETTPVEIVLVGGPDDEQKARRLGELAPSGRVHSAAGRFSLDELPALMERLSLYIGVDSGVTYIADACGVPVIDFMGPADADDQRPVGPRAIVIRSDAPCAPCSHAFRSPYGCAVGTRACIVGLPTDRLIGAALDVLRRTSADQTAPGS